MGVESPAFHLIELEKKFDQAKKELFLLDGGIIALRRPFTGVAELPVKRALECVLISGLDFVKAEQSKVRIAEALDSETKIALYERALQVVEGKRANPDSLIEVAQELADEARETSIAEHGKRGLSGFIGFVYFLMEPGQHEVGTKFHNEEQKHIGEVLECIQIYAKKWASEAKNTQSRSPIINS